MVNPAPAKSPAKRNSRRDRARILALDHDPQTLGQVREALADAGYSPIIASDPDELETIMESERPQLVLMDLMFPGADGIELMEYIFEIAGVPVIFLSAYPQEHAIVAAFDKGASDYIVKPFSAAELAARIRATLRRCRRRADPFHPGHQYVHGDLCIDYDARRVALAGSPVRLTPTEYNLLEELSANGGRVLASDTLLARAWGPGSAGHHAALRTTVKNLRRKLGDPADAPRYIHTETGVGYRMPETQHPLNPAGRTGSNAPSTCCR